MIYHVELRDREMNWIAHLDGRIANLKFGFAPVGGCAEFSFKVLSRYCEELDLGANYNVRITKRNDTTKSYDLIYQGRIENTINSILYSREDISIEGFGYQSELSDIVINVTYTNTEISAIVKDILDNYVVPNTNLTYDAGDIENTGFTADSIPFSYVTAQQALDKLAQIAGGIEWGVDASRKVYFKARSTVAGFHYPVEILRDFKINSTSREIANRIIVIGADVSGSKFTYTKDYAKNQLKYNRRDRIIYNSAVKTSAVAEQLADAEQADRNQIVDRGSFILDNETILETSLPVPLVDVKTREVTYDEKEYDTFLYAGLEPFRIRKIGYSVTEESKLVTQVDFGYNLPDIVEGVKRLKYQLENVVQSEA